MKKSEIEKGLSHLFSTLEVLQGYVLGIRGYEYHSKPFPERSDIGAEYVIRRNTRGKWQDANWFPLKGRKQNDELEKTFFLLSEAFFKDGGRPEKVLLVGEFSVKVRLLPGCVDLNKGNPIFEVNKRPA